MIRAHMGKFVITSVALVLVLSAPCASVTQAQTKPDHFWLAGRYDGNRVIIYFDAVRFGNTLPPNTPQLVEPVTGGFFLPVSLSASYLADFLKKPNAHRFALGEDYDVLIDGGAIRVKLTTLVGTEGDEGVGNDSYIGALATVIGECSLPFGTSGYYVVRPHQEPVCGSKAQPGHPIHFPTKFAKLIDEPVRFDVQTQIASLLTKRMMSVFYLADGHSPAFKVQPFRLSNGNLRYYATACWKSGDKSQRDFCLGAWLAPSPTLHILATEEEQQVSLPTILNVVDFGDGRTGIILANGGEDWGATDLVEYSDGLNAAHMRKLQSIAAGE
jgi:hypothetical protein